MGGRRDWPPPPPEPRGSLAQSLAAIAGQLAPAVPPPPPQQPSSPSPAQSAPAASPADGGTAPASGGGTSVTGRTGEAARATLNAIDFPPFVPSMNQGTVQAILDASIQPMDGHGALPQNVGKTHHH